MFIVSSFVQHSHLQLVIQVFAFKAIRKKYIHMKSLNINVKLKSKIIRIRSFFLCCTNIEFNKFSSE